jgi:hypothetical protein
MARRSLAHHRAHQDVGDRLRRQILEHAVHRSAFSHIHEHRLPQVTRGLLRLPALPVILVVPLPQPACLPQARGEGEGRPPRTGSRLVSGASSRRKGRYSTCGSRDGMLRNSRDARAWIVAKSWSTAQSGQAVKPSGSRGRLEKTYHWWIESWFTSSEASGR